ncbi:MAG: SDR family oxidoreductase [Lachnospiraceae bacterium]|jgi:gluconate 5-dehydrogenase|nr:SDR family oxidoreductase [Lachnospiraceae bacterium]
MFDTTKYFSLEGKNAIVTGGSTGLGLAITKCLVGAGARVCVLSLEDETGRKALSEYGDRVVFLPYDITVTDNAEPIVKEVLAQMGTVDILINNAGNHCKKPIEEMTVADFENVLNVHLIGAFALTKAVYSHMMTKGSGSIVFQASMASFLGLTQVSGYAAAKAGYLGLMRTLASEGGPYGIRVNAVAPGWIDTEMYRRATAGDELRQSKILGRIPLQKIGDPLNIGMAHVFLCSDAASYITGVCLPVDGGGLIGF